MREAKKLSEVCPDAHGAKEVEEDHGAVSGVIPGQAAVGRVLHEREGQLGNGASIEEQIKQGEDDNNDDAVTELGQGELPQEVP